MQQISGCDNSFDALLPGNFGSRSARVPPIRPRTCPKINEKLKRNWVGGVGVYNTKFFQSDQLLNWKLTYFGTRCYRTSDSGLAFVFGQQTKHGKLARTEGKEKEKTAAKVNLIFHFPATAKAEGNFSFFKLMAGAVGFLSFLAIVLAQISSPPQIETTTSRSHCP